MSTSADLYPAANQARVIGLLVGLFENHARCVEARGGSLDPMTFSMSSKVIGICALPDFRK